MDNPNDSFVMLTVDLKTERVVRHGLGAATEPAATSLGLYLRLGLLAATVLFTVALWLPWANMQNGTQRAAIYPSLVLHAQAWPQIMQSDWYTRLPPVWSGIWLYVATYGGVGAAGILAAALLWAQSLRLRQIGFGLLAAWSLGCVWYAWNVCRFAGSSDASQGVNATVTTNFGFGFQFTSWAVGFWLGLLALLLLWGALATYYATRQLPIAPVAESVPVAVTPSLNLRLSQAFIMLGIAAWGVSFYLSYWATLPYCNPWAFVTHQVCWGRLASFDGFIRYTPYPTGLFDTESILWTLNALAIFSAAWLCGRALFLPLRRALLPFAIWLGGASVFSLVCAWGLHDVDQQQNSPLGALVLSPTIAVAFLALALSAWGAAGLWLHQRISVTSAPAIEQAASKAQ